MLIDFFFHLRQAKLKVSINELLTLLDALKKRRDRSVDRTSSTTYRVRRWSRTRHSSTVSIARSANIFSGVQTAIDFTKEIPDEWFKQMLERTFSPEEIAKLEKLGWDKLMDEFRKRLEEQDGAHHGGN